MAIISHQCSICEAGFGAGVLVKGKCPACAVLYPNVKDKAEAMVKERPALQLKKRLTEEDVRRLAREEFNAIKVENKLEALQKAREKRAEKRGESKVGDEE
jgi:hypothetical protein